MKVNHVLILAAGKGTRMGKIGEILPKVIWPIFDKSILELEVAYARYLAPDAKIYINLFNFSEVIKKHIESHPESFKNVEVILEEEILDIGGAIHNMADKVNYVGNLLILNSDQFLFSTPSVINDALMNLKDYDSLLFSYEVNSSEGYNALEETDGQFCGVKLNKDIKDGTNIVTYTGMSLIKLEKLTRVQGKSKFFETVTNYKNNKIVLKKIKKFEYWDFGTLKRYKNSMFGLVKNIECSFFKFLVNEKAVRVESVRNYKSIITLRDFKITEKQVSYKGLTEDI